MKKLLLTLFLGYCISGYCQTEEEWNYLTKGLKIHEESGLDMKKGYSLEHIPSSSLYTGGPSFKFQYLLNDKQQKVAVSVIARYKGGNNIYFAIPLMNDKYLQNYYNTLSTFSKQNLEAYSLALSTIFINANVKNR